jgi:hypothetical protein
MYNVLSTPTEYGNTGDQPFAGSVGKWFKFIASPKGTEIATEALALLKATWVDSINSAPGDRFFVSPKIVDVKTTQDANVKETSDYGFTEEVMKGKKSCVITFFSMGVYQKNQLNKLDAKDFDLWVITENDFIIGCSYDNIKFLPKKLDFFSVLPETEEDGKAVPHVSVELKFSDTRESNLYEVALNPKVDALVPWNPTLELKGITDVFIEVVSMTATGAVIDIKNYGKVGWPSAVKEDIYFRKTSIDATAISITSATPHATIQGRYTLVFGAQTDGNFYFSLYIQGLAPGVLTPWVETRINTSHAFVSGS